MQDSQCTRRDNSASKALSEDAIVPAILQDMPVPMDESAVLICGKKLKATLQTIHARGYGHNDVKAANVFITSEGEHSMQLLPSS